MVHGPGFVATDFESAYSQHSSIWQMGLVKVRDGILGKTHAHCVFPPPCRQTLGRHNIAIHGITRRMVDNADGSGLMLPRLAAFTGDPSLAARNVVAERSMIRIFEVIGAVRRPPRPTAGSAPPGCTCLPWPRTGNTGASSSSAPRQRNRHRGHLAAGLMWSSADGY